jgi:hypothetical protein
MQCGTVLVYHIMNRVISVAGISGRAVVWVLWCCIAVPIRILESVLIGTPAEYMKYEIMADKEGFISMTAVGLFLTYTTFLPLARMHSLDPGGLCTVYLSLVAWVMGHICMNIMVFASLIGHLQLSHRCSALQLGLLRLRSISGGGYIGLLMGIAFAFPVASMRRINGDLADVSLHQWCRPADDIPAVFVCVPVLVLGMIAANVVGVTESRRPRNDRMNYDIQKTNCDDDRDELTEFRIASS